MKKGNFKSFLKSFQYAFQGIVRTIRNERNMRFHLVTALMILIFLPFFELTRLEFGLLALTVGAVISAELFNTAIEKTVDLDTQARHPLAAFAKDAAAGSVLVSAIASVVVGFCLFFKQEAFRRIWQFSLDHLWFLPLILILLCLGVFFIFTDHFEDKE